MWHHSIPSFSLWSKDPSLLKYRCLCGQASSDLSGPGFATEEAEELAVEMGVVIPGLRGTKKAELKLKIPLLVISEGLCPWGSLEPCYPAAELCVFLHKFRVFLPDLSPLYDEEDGKHNKKRKHNLCILDIIHSWSKMWSWTTAARNGTWWWKDFLGLQICRQIESCFCWYGQCPCSEKFCWFVLNLCEKTSKY